MLNAIALTLLIVLLLIQPDETKSPGSAPASRAIRGSSPRISASRLASPDAPTRLTKPIAALDEATNAAREARAFAKAV